MILRISAKDVDTSAHSTGFELENAIQVEAATDGKIRILVGEDEWEEVMDFPMQTPEPVRPVCEYGDHIVARDPSEDIEWRINLKVFRIHYLRQVLL